MNFNNFKMCPNVDTLSGIIGMFYQRDFGDL